MLNIALATALVSLAAPAPTRTELLEDAAYFSGRCYVHLSDEARIGAVHFNESDKILLDLYYEGIQESRSKPLSKSQCVNIMARVKGWIEGLSIKEPG